MNNLILDRTIVYAGPIDFWPIQQKGDHSYPACFDLHFESGLLALTHAAMSDWVLVTPTLIRIAVPGLVNMDQFHEGLALGGTLRNALVELRCAAIIDRGILTACGEVKDQLQSLSEEPDSSCGVEEEDNEFDDPVLKPYDRWFYGVDRNANDADTRPQVLGFPALHVNSARERDPNLVIYSLDDLLEEGLYPITAKIGVPRDDANYAAARRDWIEIAIESLLANIQEAITRWPVLPGEPFQTTVLIDDDIYFITLDTVDGVTVASPTASKRALEQFSLEVSEAGRTHLAQGLEMLLRAVVS